VSRVCDLHECVTAGVTSHLSGVRLEEVGVAFPEVSHSNRSSVNAVTRLETPEAHVKSRQHTHTHTTDDRP